MKNESENQVRALQNAIIKRAHELNEEHISQGQMTRTRIMEDARAKVKLMEQKELLAAKENAEREYQRRVQANEIQLQASMDRHRWGLVQSVMDKVHQQVTQITSDTRVYDKIFNQLLVDGVNMLGQSKQVAMLNHRDMKNYTGSWKKMVEGLGVEVELSEELCDCSGGLRLQSVDGSMMVDNTFEGITSRYEDELLRTIFERLFSRVPSMGVSSHG
jgi:V/A-type H+/Na+-transporting ATPase subunit E